MKFKLLASALAIAALGSGSALAATNSLGLDPTINLLTFGNFSAPSSDVEGRVAVGGNATIGSYTINWTPVYPGAGLTVAGDLSFASGDVYGNTVVGGNFTSSYSAALHGNLSIGGTLNASAGVSAASVTTWGTVTGYQPWYPTRTTGTGTFNTGIDFNAQKTSLTQLSTRLDQAADTGTAKLQYSTLVFAATNSDGVNVFDIQAGDAAKDMEITGLGSAGTVIINVHGNSVNFGGHDFVGFASARGQILFNLVDATSANVGYVEGSILAPYATITGSGGVVWGQVVAESWLGNTTQVNNAAFQGSLPVAAVPEPETYALLLAGLGLMGTISRRRRQD